MRLGIRGGFFVDDSLLDPDGREPEGDLERDDVMQVLHMMRAPA